jgi:hypothetical protein
MRREGVEISECEAVRRALLDGRELTENQLAHAEVCAVCADAVMETEIEAALEAKPGVVVPADFAARVAMRAGDEKSVRRWVRQGLRKRWPRHVGLGVAVGILLALLAVVTMSDPRWLMTTGTARLALMLVLAGEVAGLALWLGMRREM